MELKLMVKPIPGREMKEKFLALCDEMTKFIMSGTPAHHFIKCKGCGKEFTKPEEIITVAFESGCACETCA